MIERYPLWKRASAALLATGAALIPSAADSLASGNDALPSTVASLDRPNSTRACPNPMADFPFRSISIGQVSLEGSGANLAVTTQDTYSLATADVIKNDYSCIGDTSRAQFTVHNLGGEPANASTITFGVGDNSAGVEFIGAQFPYNPNSVPDCTFINGSSSAMVCKLGGQVDAPLAVGGETVITAQYKTTKPTTGQIIYADVAASNIGGDLSNDRAVMMIDSLASSGKGGALSDQNDPPKNYDLLKTLPVSIVSSRENVGPRKRAYCTPTTFGIFAKERYQKVSIKRVYNPGGNAKLKTVTRKFKTIRPSYGGEIAQPSGFMGVKVCSWDKSPKVSFLIKGRGFKLEKYVFTLPRGSYYWRNTKKPVL